MNVFNLPIARILHRETIFEDDFVNNIAGWEQISDEDEQSFILNSHYHMENKSQTRWMFYHKAMGRKLPENFIINTEIELLEHNVYGQYGLVWGFTKPHHILNRFVVSAETNRFTVSRFEKNHHHTFHRFSSHYEKEYMSKSKQFLSVMLLNDYYYFFLHRHQQPVYICHKSHMNTEGNRFGFYVEPGLLVRADKIKVQRLVISPDFDSHMWMPVGSELISGL